MPKPSCRICAFAAAESLGALHLLEQVFGDRRAGFVVPREQIERLPLPAPVLHDLRRQLDEVPRDVGARQAAHFHAAQQMMQQVSELVEDGLHFAMGQQRRLAVRPAASDCRRSGPDAAESVWRRPPVIKRIHPGAAALVLARKPVGVEDRRFASRPHRGWNNT